MDDHIPTTQAEHRATALRAAIARCKELMRSSKKRGDMNTYASYAKQMYVLQQKLRSTRRQIDESTPPAAPAKG